MPNHKTVSVIIPAFNASQTIESAVASALAQTLQPLEIIVVDDGSTDGTADIASRMTGPITVLQQPNSGPAAARNHGARKARGYWLGMLDADDWWAPEKLEHQLAEQPSASVAVIHCLSNTSAANVPHNLKFLDLWDRNWIINSSVLVRRDVFEAVGGMDEELRNTQDYHLWLRLAGLGWAFTLVPDTLVFYRTGSGISSNPERLFTGLSLTLSKIADEFNVPSDLVQKRRIKALEDATLGGLFCRKLPFARRVSREVARLSPTGPHFAVLLASHLPGPALDLRRTISSKLRPPTAAKSSLVRLDKAAVFGVTGERPTLIVVVDAEEEFDWKSLPFRSLGITNIGAQWRAQRILERFGITPTYAVDYTVASKPEGFEPLRGLLLDKKCEIGAHLHPWINPPILEDLTAANSFSGNLPSILELEKLRILTDQIESSFGHRPVFYRGGRYGSGPDTAHNLVRLGYTIDSSVLPFHDLRPQGGPDYWRAAAQPYWCAIEPTLLELPVTTVLTGALGNRTPRFAFSPLSERLFLPSILRRVGLTERIRLTPEAISLDEAKRLTRVAHTRDRQNVFMLTYHSSSLEPGKGPYVRDQSDLTRFLTWLEEYLEFFFTEMNGLASTPSALHTLAQSCRDDVMNVIDLDYTSGVISNEAGGEEP